MVSRTGCLMEPSGFSKASPTWLTRGTILARGRRCSPSSAHSKSDTAFRVTLTDAYRMQTSCQQAIFLQIYQL